MYRPLEAGEFVLFNGYKLRFDGRRVGSLVCLAYTGDLSRRPKEWVREDLVHPYPIITSTKEVA